MTHNDSRVLAEQYLPITALSIESTRERKVFTDLPPLNYLHIWWARRPIVASEAVVLASLLPAWSPELPKALPHLTVLQDETHYRAWLLRLVGIKGDPARGAQLERDGVAKGAEAFGYPQAWKNAPKASDTAALHEVLIWRWGQLPVVCDPTAGGGAIPFAAARFGLPTLTNDLNGVAVAVQHGGVVYPAELGPAILPAAQAYADKLAARLDQELLAYFPTRPYEHVAAYLYAYTIPDPRTGALVPLLPNLWLARGAAPVAVDVVVSDDGTEFAFKVVKGKDVDKGRADAGTMSNGDILNPYDSTVIDGDYVKEQVKAGNMLPVLYAVAVRDKTPGRRMGPLTFHAPREDDLLALKAARAQLQKVRPEWEATGILPTEEFPTPIPKHDIRPWGFLTWQDFFTDRQLLTHATFVKLYRDIAEEVRAELPEAQAEAVLVLLGLMHGKMLDYNSRHSAWNVNQASVRNTFESHAFGFKSTFAEKMTPGDLMRWASSQTLKAYRVSSELIEGTRPASPRASVRGSQGNAGDLTHVEAGSVACLCIDPPYYENVMYGELADFFYVWHKRTIGTVRPDWFPTPLSDIDNEAVANVARFLHMGTRRNALADADYEAKMTAIFSECRRVLRDDGVLTVMFTHKKPDAWDKLGMALISAGFTVETTWPVNTEFEYSKHQANVAAASSTVMLVCRKRDVSADGKSDTFLEDIEPEIRRTAVEAYERFRASGIDGVDLLLSTYGPTLSVVSRNWPIYSSHADEDGRARLLRPEEALAVARAEITRVQRARLVGAPVQFDSLTDFTITYWDTVQAPGTQYDIARRLAMAVGQDLDEVTKAGLVKKEGGMMRLLTPKERASLPAQARRVHPDASAFASLIDALHTAVYVADEDGLERARHIMSSAGLLTDSRFQSLLQAMIRAVPRERTAGGAFVHGLAGTLDRLCLAYFPDVVVPAEPTRLDAGQGQGDLFDDLLT